MKIEARPARKRNTRTTFVEYVCPCGGAGVAVGAIVGVAVGAIVGVAAGAGETGGDAGVAGAGVDGAPVGDPQFAQNFDPRERAVPQ